jgi:hypothetical protein
MALNQLLLTALLLATPFAGAAEWTDFRWVGFGAYPHAAVLLPAKIDGVASLVQLDTGANARFIPSARSAVNAPSRAVSIEIGAHAVQATLPESLLATLHEGGASKRAGSVGNGFFEAGTLTLDLKRARFSYAPQAALRDDSDAAPFKYVHHEGWDGGHIIVPVTLPGQPPQDAMLDTGAAIFTFTPLQKSWYDALRGADRQQLTVSSWGNDIGCETSQLGVPIRVSRYTLDTGVLGYCKLPVDIGVPLAGIIGLAGFAQQTITIDYPSRKWKVTR